MSQATETSQSHQQTDSHLSAQNELRATVKMWEREFETKNNRKPTSSDAKSNKEIWLLYQRYRNYKRQATMGTNKSSHKSPSKASTARKTDARHMDLRSPSKRVSSSYSKRTHASTSTPTKKSTNQSIDGDSETEADETPRQQKVTEVFPTPRLKGKVLGLFDVELPETPQKKVRTESSETTPCKQLNQLETPQSKKTPDYFLYRVNLFPSSEPEMADSPLFKRKKPLFTPLMVAQEMDSVQDETLIRAESANSSESSVLNQPDALENQHDANEDNDNQHNNNQHNDNQPHTSNEPNESNNAPITQKRMARRGPKRQTKRVIMRPITKDSNVSTAKATDNYRRLKINNTKRRPFKRR